MGKSLLADRMAGFKLPAYLGALASGATNTDQEIARFVAPHDMKLAAAYGVFIAALTGAATNYIKFSIVNLGTAGSGTTEMAALDFLSTAITVAAMAPKAFTLEATTVANLLISAGEVVSIKAAHQGTGVAYPIGSFFAHFTMQ